MIKRLSVEDISELVEVPVSTVKDGVAKAQRYLRENGYLDDPGADRLPKLNPRFRGHLVLPRNERRADRACEFCESGHLNTGDDFCPFCSRTSPENELRINGRSNRDDVAESRTKINNRLADVREAEAEEAARAAAKAERATIPAHATSAPTDGASLALVPLAASA